MTEYKIIESRKLEEIESTMNIMSQRGWLLHTFSTAMQSSYVVYTAVMMNKP